MPDYGALYADRKISDVQKELKRTYRTAQKELKKKLETFNRKHEQKCREKKQQLEEGKISKSDYQNWLTGQVFIRNQWESNIRQVNAVMLDCNMQSMRLINEKKLDVFAENYNFLAFKAEREMVGSFNVYSAESVARLILDNPKILPEWKIDEKKDYDWNYQKVNNIVKQGIIQGEGVREITERLCTDLCTMNENKMRMFARTAMTGAQNAGRQQQMNDAADMGIDVHKQWLATMDNRTRDSHRYLDGQEVAYNEAFVSLLGELEYPGDPDGEPADVYNCRCTMVTIYPKYEDRSKRDWREDIDIDGQDYEEWKEGKQRQNKEFTSSEGRNIIDNGRGMANSLRQPDTPTLTDDEISQLKQEIKELKADESVFMFNVPNRDTGYYDEKDLIILNRAVLPAVDDSRTARDRLTSKSVIAHEYYGHRAYRGTKLPRNDWRDEFRASYMAALKAPSLTRDERQLLMRDALDRAKEAGVTIKTTRTIRRILYGTD